MASSWGNSWGLSWLKSWGSVATPQEEQPHIAGFVNFLVPDRKRKKRDNIREEILAAERQILGLDKKIEETKQVEETRTYLKSDYRAPIEQLELQLAAAKTRLERLIKIYRKIEEEEEETIFLNSLPFMRV